MFGMTIRRSFAAGLIACAFMAGGVHAHEFKAGNLEIDHPWTRATPKGAKTAGGYLKITNKGQEADRLIGGSAGGAESVEVHEMSVENNVMKMRQLTGGLEIKPGETVELKPGSYHLMMIGLKKPYEEGELVKGSLTFESRHRRGGIQGRSHRRDDGPFRRRSPQGTLTA